MPSDIKFISFSLSSLRNRQSFFEIGFMTYDLETLRAVSDRYGTLIEQLSLKNLKQCTIEGVVSIPKDSLAFHRLSKALNLQVLIFQGTKSGVVDFVASLIDFTPQCDVHTQICVCLKSFEPNPNPNDEDGNDESSSGDSDLDGDSADEDKGSEDIGTGRNQDSSSGNEGRGGSFYQTGDETGDEDEEDSPGDNQATNAYWSLCNHAVHCTECERRGQSFLPSLRHLVFRYYDLPRW
ncbi:hypothetical protein AX16_003954 [Volvariella volvacea WC 439]|nr:hypothetical protein AX16_003954 [Volvariella volvacea WC 439]